MNVRAVNTLFDGMGPRPPTGLIVASRLSHACCRDLAGGVKQRYNE
jgi:hypothetical protein